MPTSVKVIKDSTSNKIQLLGWYGGDKAIAQAAWTSTGQDVEEKSEEQIRDLIVNKLWNNSSGKAHKTPFERGLVHFNIICDDKSHIHLLKHRMANINGESARYKELKEDMYYLPDDWDIESSEAHILYDEDIYRDLRNWREILKAYTEMGNRFYHKALKDLTPILGRKRAKESARFFRTGNTQLTLDVMMNMSCFYNFITLRSDEAAQLEIRNISDKMLKLVSEIPNNPFKYTLEAWNK